MIAVKRFYFRKEIKYDNIISPVGDDFENMSPSQAKEYFQWFSSNIDDRIAYLNTMCAKSMRKSSSRLDYSPNSLVLLWKWFLKTARLEPTPREELEEMENGAKVFGESFINYEHFTPTSKMVMQDIAIYLGECYVKNYDNLYWCYRTRPKRWVGVNRPVIGGFSFKTKNGGTEEAYYQPLGAVEGAAANLFDFTAKKTDLLDNYQLWLKYISK